MRVSSFLIGCLLVTGLFLHLKIATENPHTSLGKVIKMSYYSLLKNR